MLCGTTRLGIKVACICKLAYSLGKVTCCGKRKPPSGRRCEGTGLPELLHRDSPGKHIHRETDL